MTETESKLLELATRLKADDGEIDKATGLNPSDVECELIESETTIEDIDDLVSNNFDRILTNKDYLILNGMNNKSIDVVANENGVSINYVKKLMRSSSGSEFLKNNAKQRMQTAMDISSLAVAEGVLHYQKYVNDLFARGEINLGISFLFGKSSLLEIQNQLHKQQQGVVEDDSGAMKSLFTSLLSDAVKK